MNADERREVVKALAYGKTNAEIRLCMEVSDEEIQSITEREIVAKSAELRAKGYIK